MKKISMYLSSLVRYGLCFVVIGMFFYTSLSAQTKSSRAPVKKDWTLMVYMAANNNLHNFSLKNIQQMLHVGSTQHINVLVHLDGFQKSDIRRYYIQKHDPVLVSTLDHSAETVTGTPQSLYNFAEWAIEAYPAEHYILLLWNHGSGIKDPSIWGKKIMLYRDQFFSINYETGLLRLNRRSLDSEDHDRGIAFNDTHETYLTNQELTKTLGKISNNLLDGNKIDVLCLDACFMAMVEICSQVKDYVRYMVGSEELEPGGGYNYAYVLEPFQEKSLSPREFVTHVVDSYKQEYKSVNSDLTQSAIDLKEFAAVEDCMKDVTKKCLEILEHQKGSFLSSCLRTLRLNGRYTTEFYDFDYIDCADFLKHFADKLDDWLDSSAQSHPLYKQVSSLKATLEECCLLIHGCVLENVVGTNLLRATGLSIYFPSRVVHSSYFKTIFDEKTQWSELLEWHLKTRNVQEGKSWKSSIV